MSSPKYRVFEFGEFRLDEEEMLLSRGGEPVQLSPKALETLVVFLKNSGRILEKEWLMQMIWRDTFVEEANLAVNISTLRKILGEQRDGRQFIETIPRRGYRFSAPVRETSEEDDEEIVIKQRITANLVFEEDTSSIVTGEPMTGNIIDVTPEGSLFLPEQVAHKALPPFRRPETHYTMSGDVNIAYQVIGDGAIDIVFVMGWVSHLEYFWEEPLFSRFLLRLASFSRLILFDKRGTGLSDRVPVNELPTLEQRMDDVRAVMEAVGSERASLIGVSEGGPMCGLFAATYPEKTSALVMIGTYAKRIREEDYPWGPTTEEREHFFEEIRRHWGGPLGIEERAPSAAADEQFRNWWATYLRMGASPGAALALTKMNAEIDVRKVFPSVRIPTLVLHRKGDTCLKVEEGRYVASLIPGSKYVELDGIDHLPFVGEQDEILDEIEEFLTGVRHHEEFDRVLATVLCVQIGGATMQAAFSGDGQSRDLIDRFHGYAKREIELFRGREIKVFKGGFMATFDGPARAIRCAAAIRDSAERLRLEARIGLHTGECDLLGDKVEGIALEISANIASQGRENDVFVSSTVKDLVAGSGIKFAEAGDYNFGEPLGTGKLFKVQR